MRVSETKKLIELIDCLSGLTDQQRQALLDEVRHLQKEIDKIRFKYERIKTDRTIVERALHSSIEDLEKKQKHIEQINKTLSKQKEKLKKQKEIIEEKSLILSENLRKLEMSYHEMEQFAYIASHDLKSPLRTISNFAQLLKRRNYHLLDEASREFIDYIVSGAKQMNEVICDSLEYSKINKGEQSFQRVNLNEVLQIVLLNLQKEIEESGAVVETDRLPVMKANKTSILQLFQNLISNAIKFRGTEPPVIKITCKKQNNGYRFTVSDNGTGMDETYQEKAFQPFQRLNDRDKPGTGMGLAICKKVVHMHGGDIRFESKNGGGTTFLFSICDKTPVLPTNSP